MSAALLAALLAAPLRASAPAVTFEADPRVELLAVVHMLAEPEAFSRRFPDGAPDYARRAREKFSPFAGHPAAARLRRLLGPGRRIAPARLLLDCSAPPALAEERDVDADSPPRSKEDRAFLEELRDFAARSRFMSFYGENAAYYAELVRVARAEADRGLPPESVAGYLRRGAPARRRFLISGLLPWELAANAGDARIRSALYGRSMFDLEDPGTGPAHEIAHELLGPLARRHREELEAYAGLMTAGCTDSWLGCVMAHVDLAVTLRVLASRRGEKEYASALERYRRLPFLAALGERLKEWEAGAGGSFEEFYPRLVAVFREALIKDAAARARTAMAARAAAASSEPAPSSAPAEVVMTVDPRVELLSVLRLLAGPPEAPSEPKPSYRRDAELWFSGFSTHSAVALAAALRSVGAGADLPAEIVLRLSEPPDMYAPDPIPEGYVEAAGGEESVERFIEALNDFARASRFTAFYEAHRADYAAFAARAEAEALASISPKAVQAYVGSPMSARYYFALAPLLSEQSAANFSLRRRDRLEEVRLRPSRYSPARGHQFLFNHFGSSLAHELVHTVINPLVASFESSGAKAPAGCNDRTGNSWSGCMQEHLVYAVTMRILAQDLGEELYGEMADRYKPRGFPYLGLLGERLKEYEADRARYRTLREFYPRLEEVFAEALPLGAPAEPSVLDPKSRRLKDEGVKDFVAGRFDDALRRFKEALELSPRDAEALLNLGVVYERLGRRDEALESYGGAVALSSSGAPRDRDIRVAALSSRATLLRASGRASEARRDLELVLKVAPADWEGREDVERRLAHDR